VHLEGQTRRPNQDVWPEITAQASFKNAQACIPRGRHDLAEPRRLVVEEPPLVVVAAALRAEWPPSPGRLPSPIDHLSGHGPATNPFPSIDGRWRWSSGHHAPSRGGTAIARSSGRRGGYPSDPIGRDLRTRPVPRLRSDRLGTWARHRLLRHACGPEPPACAVGGERAAEVGPLFPLDDA
jgi:hypothetical protein